MHIFQRLLHRRNIALSVVLVALIVFLLLPELTGNRQLTKATFSLMFLVCLYTVSTNRRIFVIALLLLLTGVVSNWVEEIAPSRALTLFSLGAQAAFLIYGGALLLRDVLSSQKFVTFNTILGAINVYLILGVIWTQFYLIALVHDPGAFRFAGSVDEGDFAELLAHHTSQLTYYSFVTLSTLGYGDVTAAAPITRLLAVFEALFGQFYLVILVAGLVEKQAERSRLRQASSGGE